MKRNRDDIMFVDEIEQKKVKLYNKAIIYTRVSTSYQADDNNFSLARQMEVCKTKARDMGFEIENEITEIKSGFRINKQIELFGKYKKNKLVSNGLVHTMYNKVLIIYAVDRLTRDYEKGLNIVNKLLSNGNTIISVTEDFDIKTEEGYNKFKDLLLIGYHSSLNLSNRRNAYIKEIRDKGGFLGNTKPYGYNIVKDNIGIKFLVPVPDEQVIITQIITLFTSAVNSFINNIVVSSENIHNVLLVYKEQNINIICSKIADILNQEGYLYINMRKWYLSNVKTVIKRYFQV